MTQKYRPHIWHTHSSYRYTKTQTTLIHWTTIHNYTEIQTATRIHRVLIPIRRNKHNFDTQYYTTITQKYKLLRKYIEISYQYTVTRNILIHSITIHNYTEILNFTRKHRAVIPIYSNTDYLETQGDDTQKRRPIHSNTNYLDIKTYHTQKHRPQDGNIKHLY